MNSSDPNLAKVELIAAALGALCDELVFVGGCAAGLLMSDPAATPARVTFDVDLVAEVAALRDYHQMEAAFADRGFTRDLSPDAPICRWPRACFSSTGRARWASPRTRASRG